MASAAPATFLNCFQEFLESDGGAESIGDIGAAPEKNAHQILRTHRFIIQRQLTGELTLLLYEFVAELWKRYIRRQRKGMQP
jgi:hypothetical protein